MQRVAVINRTNLKNYGSVLQCYALNKVISNLGYNSEVVWVTGNMSKNFDFRPRKMISSLFKLIFHPKLWKSTLAIAKWVNEVVVSEEIIELYEEFVSQEINQTLFSYKELVKKAKTDEYFKFVCGSDQIWCSTTLYVDPLMYLRFAPKEKRIAYAPSIGREFIPNHNRRKMKRFISQIPCVSVREKSGQKLIKDLIGREVALVADPTLLLNKEDWDVLKKDCSIEGKYILCYFLETPTENTQHKIAKVAQEKGLSIVALYSKLTTCEKDGCKVLYPSVGPREFLGIISEANEVITDSYHGMLFSMIYQKYFWSMERVYTTHDQSSRQRSLLEFVGLMDRYIREEDDFVANDDSGIDYTSLNEKIKNFKQFSLEYLINSLHFNEGKINNGK